MSSQCKKCSGFEQASNLRQMFSGLVSRSVMAEFASIIMSRFNCYCWTSITMEFTYLSRVLRPVNIKGQPTDDHSHVVLKAELGEHCTGIATVVGLNPIESLTIFSGLFSSSVMATFTSIIISTFSCYCWTSISMEVTYLSWVLLPLNMKGQPTHDRSHVALIAQLGEHCTCIAKVVGSNPVQSLKIFSALSSSSVMAAFASIIMSTFNYHCWTSIT